MNMRYVCFAMQNGSQKGWLLTAAQADFQAVFISALAVVRVSHFE